MQDNNTIIAVEVKYRASLQYGGAIAAISQNKINKIKRTFFYFCKQRHLLHHDMRIDAITIENKLTISNLTWLQNITS
jgi:putative endonuclease